LPINERESEKQNRRVSGERNCALPCFGIEHSNGGLITFPGGVPLKNSKGEVVGAIGVSGSTVENDHTVAAAGAAALGK